MGDYIADYYWDIKGDTRGLDYGSFRDYGKLESTIAFWGYIGNIGIMEMKKLNYYIIVRPTSQTLGFRAQEANIICKLRDSEFHYSL